MRVAKVIRECITFIGVKRNGKFIPKATGFFVGYTEDQFYFSHLVTAEHVISGLLSRNEEIWLRLNLKGEQISEPIRIDGSSFRSHPDNERIATDVAVCPFNDGTFVDDETGKKYQPDIRTLRLNGEGSFAVTRQELGERNLGIGDEVNIVGLFRSHYGLERNIPIIRIGNIAAMPEEPVPTRYCGFVEAYLVEARSIGGLSGSSVFVRKSELQQLNDGFKAGGEPVQNSWLLGLMHGHFDVTNLNEDVVVDEDDPGSASGIHTGIGVVIPTHKIVETIQHPELTAMRKEIAAKNRLRRGATADVDVAESEPATQNNRDREADSMRLVGEASKNRTPAGHT